MKYNIFFLLQIQSKCSWRTTPMGMCVMCPWPIYLSKSRCYRWQTGAKNKLIVAAWRIIWSWLWFNIYNICSTFSLYFSAIRPSSKLAIFSSNQTHSITHFFFLTKFSFQCFCALILFYCAHWQAYVSGTLRFGKVDVTEAQIIICGIHLLSAIFGPSIWMTKVKRILYMSFN